MLERVIWMFLLQEESWNNGTMIRGWPPKKTAVNRMYFSQWITNLWNTLSLMEVQSRSEEIFKVGMDKILKDRVKEYQEN